MTSTTFQTPSLPAKTSFVARLRVGGWKQILPIAAVFLGLLAAASVVLIQCPPLWRDYDGLIQISNRPNDMTILQYPAAYPFFSRLHVYAAAIVQGWIHHQKVNIDIWKGVNLNDAGIRALMVSQELLLALVLTGFVLGCARSTRARVWTVLLLVSNASLFVIANLVSTEALAEILMIAVVATGLWIFRSDKPSMGWMIAYALCLYAGIMTRHTNAIFAMLLPTAYLLRFAVDWVRTHRAAIAPWKGAATFVIIGVLSIGAARLTTRLLCHVFHVEYHSTSAHTTSERLGFVRRMPEPEREAFLAGLVQSASDPVVREAIPLLARPAAWDKQRDAIIAILHRQSPELDDAALKLKADGYLTTVTDLSFRTFNRYLMGETWESVWRTFSRATASEATSFLINTGAWSIDLYAEQFSKKTHELQVCSPQAKQRIITFEKNPWLRLWRWLPYGVIFLVGFLAALFFLIRGIGDPSGPIFALATAATGITTTCLTFFLTNYNPRFTIFADIFGWLALAIVLAHGLDSRRRPSSVAANPSVPEAASATN